MKTLIYGSAQAKELRRIGRKVRSHGTFRAKRHPNSKRLVNNERSRQLNPQYKVV